MSSLTGQETISDILTKYPSSEKVLMKYFKSMCFHCPMSTMETIEQGASAHGADIKKILADLNKAIDDSEK